MEVQEECYSTLNPLTPSSSAASTPLLVDALVSGECGNRELLSGHVSGKRLLDHGLFSIPDTANGARPFSLPLPHAHVTGLFDVKEFVLPYDILQQVKDNELLPPGHRGLVRYLRSLEDVQGPIERGRSSHSIKPKADARTKKPLSGRDPPRKRHDVDNIVAPKPMAVALNVAEMKEYEQLVPLNVVCAGMTPDINKTLLLSDAQEHADVEKCSLETDAEVQPMKKVFVDKGLFAADRIKPISPLSFPLPLKEFNRAWTFELADFQLRWDLYALSNKNSWFSDTKPLAYATIRSNVFVSRKRTPHSIEYPRCLCSQKESSDNSLVPIGHSLCGSNCINRMMYYECSASICAFGADCSNRRLQGRSGIQDIEVFHTGRRGFGVRSVVAFPPGHLVQEYCGEVITTEEAAERFVTDYSQHGRYYFLGYGGGEVLDAGRKGTLMRFINHSCSPNCAVEKWHVPNDAEPRMVIVTRRTIAAGEELTYDYNFDTFDASGLGGGECQCGADDCRGVIGKRTAGQVREQLREKKASAGKGKSEGTRKRISRKRRLASAKKEPTHGRADASAGNCSADSNAWVVHDMANYPAAYEPEDMEAFHVAASRDQGEPPYERPFSIQRWLRRLRQSSTRRLTDIVDLISVLRTM